MKLLDILHEPWAILPEKKTEIDTIYATHLRGEKIDIRGIEAALGRPLHNAPAGAYEIVNGVAILDFSGVMAKRMNFFMEISGGFSTQIATALVNQAAADESVTAILITLDSPGGAVDGTADLAAAIGRAAASKPVAAIADGVMASAAYWAGSSASRVYAANGATLVGSIGVVATHVDVSGREAKFGIKTTEITAGRYKRIASSYAPLSESGRQSIQDQADYLYGVFLDAVAANRGIESRDAVHERMADGRLFIGQQAVDAGLVDGIASAEEVLALLTGGEIPVRATQGTSATVIARPSTTTAAGAAADTSQENDMKTQTDTAVTAEQAQPFVDAAVATARKEIEPQLTTARTESATAERARVQGVLAINAKMPGHETLVNTLAFDGTTTPEQALAKVVDADVEKRKGKSADLRADAPAPVPAAAAPAAEPKADETQEDPHAIAHKASTYIAEQAKLGNTVSAAAAVAHVTAKEK
jgi:signal peptide peptidase SppA